MPYSFKKSSLNKAKTQKKDYSDKILKKNKRSIPDKLFNEAVKDRALRGKDSVLLLYIAREVTRNKLGYLDTYANEMKGVLGVKSKESVSRAVHRLKDAGYIIIELVPYKHDRVKHHYRFYIHPSKLTGPLATNKNIHSMDISKSNKSIRKDKKIIKREEKTTEKQKAISVIVTSEGREKPKNTTVQDMLRIYNEITGGNVTFSDAYRSKLMRYLYVAFKIKFRDLERWRRYVTKATFGKIRNAKRFLFYLLAFVNIDSGISAMEREEMIMKEHDKYVAAVQADEDAIFAEIEALNEPEEVKSAYAKILKKGAAVYRNWVPHIRIVKGDYGVEVLPAPSEESAFAADYVRTYFL